MKIDKNTKNPGMFTYFAFICWVIYMLIRIIQRQPQLCFNIKYIIFWHILWPYFKCWFAISTTTNFEDQIYLRFLFTEGFNVTVVKGDANDLQMDLKTTETAPYKAKSLIYPIVGLSVVAVIITAVYIYTLFTEKRILPTNSV